MESHVSARLGKLLRSAVRELRRFAYSRPIRPTKGESRPRPRLGLALGGGFARGLAHIGVLKVLVENQIPIDALAGTSAGAIAAAAFASGCTIEELTAAARRMRWSNLARWTFPRLGFATNERMEWFLSKVLHCRTFEELKLPLAVVATEVTTGAAVVFREGDLMPPLRASCSFPGLFVPIELNGRMLVDGAIVSSVPVQALRGMDAIVAVHMGVQGLRYRPKNLFEVVGESFRIVESRNESAWRDHCDLVIEPEVAGFRWDDFERADELIEAGEMAARRTLPALRHLIQERAAGHGMRETPKARAASPFPYTPQATLWCSKVGSARE